jgi:hypothetical protein
MIAFSLGLSRLVPLVHLLWIQPIWVWPAPALALITAQSAAIFFAFNAALKTQHIGLWRGAEALHFTAWGLFALCQSGQAQPSGGLPHALLALLSACLSPSLTGKRNS